jgi:hypothetical protein
MPVKHNFKHKLCPNKELVQKPDKDGMRRRENVSSLGCSHKMCNELRAILQVKVRT